jgi:hypothetical protein
LRPAHGADDQRAHYEGADANHVDHVQGYGFFQAEAADQAGVLLQGIPGR